MLAAHAWSGFASESDKQPLAAIMERTKRQGFCVPDTADVDDLIDSADNALFKQIIADSNHVLAHLLRPRENRCALWLWRNIYWICTGFHSVKVGTVAHYNRD